MSVPRIERVMYFGRNWVMSNWSLQGWRLAVVYQYDRGQLPAYSAIVEAESRLFRVPLRFGRGFAHPCCRPLSRLTDVFGIDRWCHEEAVQDVVPAPLSTIIGGWEAPGGRKTQGGTKTYRQPQSNSSHSRPIILMER